MPRSASPAVAVPSRPPPSTPRSRTQPTRMKPQQHTPGIITLPQAKSSDSSSTPSSSPNPSRHSQSGSSPHPRGADKPLPTVEDPASKDGENRRRRRGKQNRSDSPLKQSVELEAPLPVGGGDEMVNSNDTPSKTRRRRGGRANRQASPPLPEGDAGAVEQPFPSTTPPQADFDAFSSLHSRSVPPDPNVKHHLHPRSRFPEAQSSGDEWEVPAVPVKPKENLSWQQELLRSGSTSSSSQNVRAKGHESPQSRPRSRVNGKDARTTGSLGSSTSNGAKSRPPLQTSISDNGTASGASLNWQQELLLHTPDLSTLHQPSPVKPVSNLTPARQRRYQQRDNITFGLGELDLDDGSDELDDIFASPGRNGNGGSRNAPPHLSQASSRNRTNPSSAAATGFSTPTKPVQPVEPRYAGPTFHNSPAPSSLPVPSFMLRRKVDGVAA